MNPTVEPAALLDSLALRLHQIGFAHYQSSGAYPTALTVPVVTFSKLPQNIVSAVSLAHYLTDPDPMTVEHNPLHYVQLTFREPGPDPRPVIRRERAAFRALHSMLPATWPGGVSPLAVTFSSAAPADPDEDGNWTKAANYAIRLNPGEMQ